MRGRRQKSGNNWIGIAIAFLVVAIAAVGIWLGVAWIGRYFTVSSPTVTLTETTLPVVLPDPVPPNQYDLTAFGVDGEFITYSGAESTTRGIDVSDHQGVIDWEQVARDGIDFAVVRIGYRGYTQGGITMDAYYEENIQGALDNGIEVGVYFFSQAISEEEALEEAAVVLDAIAGYDITYPVVFDWEEVSAEARTDHMTSVLLTQCTIAFCEAVREAGYVPGVYFNQTFGYQYFHLSELQDYVLWLAQYDTAPDFLYNFQMWQYTARGTVAGIDTPMDLNLSFWQPD